MGFVLESVVIDAVDPSRLARWWAEALGYQVTYEEDDGVEIRPSAQALPGLLFQPADGGKESKNRLHLDLRPTDREAEVERLVDMGARHVDVGQREDQPWTVLADPEGNEFCVLSGRG